MLKADFDYMVFDLQKEAAKAPDPNRLKLVLELLLEASLILFKGPVYIPVKWHHFGRIWRLAKIVIKMVRGLMKDCKERKQSSE